MAVPGCRMHGRSSTSMPAWRSRQRPRTTGRLATEATLGLVRGIGRIWMAHPECTFVKTLDKTEILKVDPPGMNTMINRPRKLALLAIVAAGLMPAAAAHAHWNCIFLRRARAALSVSSSPLSSLRQSAPARGPTGAERICDSLLTACALFLYVRRRTVAAATVQWQRGDPEEAPVTIQTEESVRRSKAASSG